MSTKKKKNNNYKQINKAPAKSTATKAKAMNPRIVGIIVVVSIIAVVGIIFAILALCGSNNTNQTSTSETVKPTQSSTTSAVLESVDTESVKGMHHAVIDIKDYGTITVELNGDVAPITVYNFMKLAKEGFYDGLTFHRIMEGFMMQGGDPLGTGSGGSDQNIKGEFSANGVENNLSHTRGAISMARATPMNSASSQFFIVHEDSTFLDGQYACFGYVTEGIEVVDKVCTAAQPTDSNGSIAKDQQPIINSIKIID